MAEATHVTQPTQPTQATQPTQPSAYNPSTDVLRQELAKQGVVVRLMGTTVGDSFHIDVKLRDSKLVKGEVREWTFGRNKNSCTYALPMESTRISNKHFKLSITSDLNKDGKLMIQDTSTNGTWLNNSKLDKLKNYILTQGDEISVGNGVPKDVIKFVVHLPVIREREQGGIHKDFIVNDQVVGSGAFATVKKAIERSTGETFAVKIISKRKAFTSGLDGVTRELNILKNLDHPNIVKLKAFYEDDTDYYIVMEYVPGGDLMDFIAAYGAIEETPSKEIARQIIEAIDHVHSKGISHRDLKPDNVLIAHDDPVVVKITDFGLAKSKESEGTMKTFCGTLAYLAPEVLSNKRTNVKKRYLGNGKVKEDSYSNKVDMWSIGCLLFVIMTGHLPFSGATQEQMFANISNGEFHEKSLIQKGVSPEGRDFITRLIEPDVELRLDAKQALRHPWLKMGDSSSGISQSQSTRVLSQIREFKVPATKPKRGEMLVMRRVEIDKQQDQGAASHVFPTTITIPQGQPLFTIGRVKCNDVEVRDERVSKVHCLIMKRRHPVTSGMDSAAMALDDLWVVSNGTNACFLNEVRLAKGEKMKLFEGDILTLFADKRSKVRLDYKVEIHDWTGLYKPLLEEKRRVVVCDESDRMALTPREELASEIVVRTATAGSKRRIDL